MRTHPLDSAATLSAPVPGRRLPGEVVTLYPESTTRAAARQFRLGVIGLLLAAIAVRLWLQFRTPFAPGINGAYYLVQARALLERGELGIPDLPLTFFLHAGFAWLLQHLCGLTQEGAITVAVRTLDAILPTLAIAPIAVLGWLWQPKHRRSVLAALAPAALVGLSSASLGMLGDFAKNSLALVWLAALMLAAHYYLSQPSPRRALWPLTFLVLCGLTHIGVLGAALIFMLALLAVNFVFGQAQIRRQILSFTLAAAALLALVAVVLSIFDPTRLERLANAIVSPSTFTSSGGGPGGPGGFAPPHFALSGWLFLALGGWALWAVWQGRSNLSTAQLTVVAAAAITIIIVGGPFYDGDKTMRLTLIALTPAAVTLAFLFSQLAVTPQRVLAGLLLTGILLSTATSFGRGSRSAMTEASYAELTALRAQIPAGSKTLVVARHGLEWWAAWVLHTNIAQPKAVRADDWSRFSQVFYLNENRRSRFRGGFGFPPPPGLGFGGPPPGGFPPPPPKHMMSAQIPDDAHILHNGRYFKLARVTEPPSDLNSDS